MMVNSALDIYLKEAGVPDHVLSKVKSTIYAWFVIGLLSGVVCGGWMVVVFVKYG